MQIAKISQGLGSFHSSSSREGSLYIYFSDRGTKGQKERDDQSRLPVFGHLARKGERAVPLFIGIDCPRAFSPSHNPARATHSRGGDTGRD